MARNRAPGVAHPCMTPILATEIQPTRRVHAVEALSQTSQMQSLWVVTRWVQGLIECLIGTTGLLPSMTRLIIDSSTSFRPAPMAPDLNHFKAQRRCQFLSEVTEAWPMKYRT